MVVEIHLNVLGEGTPSSPIKQLISPDSFGDEGVPAPSMLGKRALIAAEAGDLRYYINALHIAL